MHRVLRDDGHIAAHGDDTRRALPRGRGRRRLPPAALRARASPRRAPVGGPAARPDPARGRDRTARPAAHDGAAPGRAVFRRRRHRLRFVAADAAPALVLRLVGRGRARRPAPRRVRPRRRVGDRAERRRGGRRPRPRRSSSGASRSSQLRRTTSCRPEARAGARGRTRSRPARAAAATSTPPASPAPDARTVAFTDSTTAVRRRLARRGGRGAGASAPVAGGPVEPARPRSAPDWAGFFVEYGPHAVATVHERDRRRRRQQRRVRPRRARRGPGAGRAGLEDGGRRPPPRRGHAPTVARALRVEVAHAYDAHDLTGGRARAGRLFGAPARRGSGPAAGAGSPSSAARVLPVLAYARLVRRIGADPALRGPFLPRARRSSSSRWCAGARARPGDTGAVQGATVSSERSRTTAVPTGRRGPARDLGRHRVRERAPLPARLPRRARPPGRRRDRRGHPGRLHRPRDGGRGPRAPPRRPHPRVRRAQERAVAAGRRHPRPPAAGSSR